VPTQEGVPVRLAALTRLVKRGRALSPSPDYRAGRR